MVNCASFLDILVARVLVQGVSVAVYCEMRVQKCIAYCYSLHAIWVEDLIVRLKIELS